MQRQHLSSPPRKAAREFRRLSRSDEQKQALERLKRFDPGSVAAQHASTAATVGEGAYVNYARHLTPEGGILITYRDLDWRLHHTIARIAVWTTATGFEAWLLTTHSSVNGLLFPFWLIGLGALNWWLVRKPPEISRSIEIRPDCMIVDGCDRFWLNQMRDTWPAFQGDDEGRILCGIYGSRFIEYTTAYRIDACDRTPDILAAHLKDAMEQLWGRKEIVFDPFAPD